MTTITETDLYLAEHQDRMPCGAPRRETIHDQILARFGPGGDLEIRECWAVSYDVEQGGDMQTYYVAASHDRGEIDKFISALFPDRREGESLPAVGRRCFRLEHRLPEPPRRPGSFRPAWLPKRFPEPTPAMMDDYRAAVARWNAVHPEDPIEE